MRLRLWHLPNKGQDRNSSWRCPASLCHTKVMEGGPCSSWSCIDVEGYTFWVQLWSRLYISEAFGPFLIIPHILKSSSMAPVHKEVVASVDSLARRPSPTWPGATHISGESNWLNQGTTPLYHFKAASCFVPFTSHSLSTPSQRSPAKTPPASQHDSQVFSWPILPAGRHGQPMEFQELFQRAPGHLVSLTPSTIYFGKTLGMAWPNSQFYLVQEC